MRRGLQLLCARVQIAASAAAHDLSTVAASCLEFPLQSGLRPAHSFASVALQDAVCAPVTSALLAAVFEAATAPATLAMLPSSLALHLKLRALVAACHACVPLADASAHQAVIATTQDVLTRVVDLWRRGRELQAELARRGDLAFKTNAQRERVFTLTEEDEDEAAFRADHRSMTAAFADLLDGPHEDDDAAADAAIALATVDDDEASMAAVSRQLAATLEDPAIQRAIVGMHTHVASVLFRDALLPSAPSAAAPHYSVAEHAASLADTTYELGAALLQSQSGCLEAWVDAPAAAGVLRRLLRQLDVIKVRAKRSEEGVDVALPCLAEAQLAVAPVQNLVARLDALLARFPEQPMLLQIHAVSTRLLGASRGVPVSEFGLVKGPGRQVWGRGGVG